MADTGTTITGCCGAGALTSNDAIIPDLNNCCGLGIVTSISKTRLFGSADGEIRVIRPRNSLPGSASAVTVNSPPNFNWFRVRSGTPNIALTEVMSATVNPVLPGETSWPASTVL